MYDRRTTRFEQLESRRVLMADPVISEFQAINDTTLQDADGDFSDWIEIRNVDPEPLSLGGWYLTDDATDLRKWRFPDTTVPGNDELVVFASDKDRAVSGGELHTNFRLSGEGEYLALVKPDGVTVAHDFAPAFPPQNADQSYGIAVGRNVTTLVQRDALVTTRVPADDSLGDTWRQPGFDDSAWPSGQGAIGFERLAPGYEIVEDFSQPLGPEWTVDIPAGGTSTVAVEDSKLVVSAPAGQTDSDENARGLAPFVYRDLPDNAINYDLVTQFESPSSGHIGMIVYDAGTQRSILQVEYQSRTNVRMIGPKGDRLGSVRDTAEDVVFLRLQRDGVARRWNAYYKVADGDDWSLIGSVNDDSEAMVPIIDPKVGVQVSSTNNAVTARFDRFQILVADAPSVYGARLGLDLEAEMFQHNSSVYARIPFTVTGNPAQFDHLSMAVSYDDGFRAFVNGQEIAAENVPFEATWQSTASSQSGAVRGRIPLKTLDLSNSLGLLQEGDNLLAIHGMNVAADDADFFFEATLAASQTVPRAAQFFVTPSPGEPNLLRAAQAPTIVGQQGAFFGSRTVELKVDNAAPTIEIRYTLDGTLPTINSPRYAGPLVLTDTAMLQARAFDVSQDSVLEPSNVSAGTFVAISPELQDVSSDIPLVVLDTLGGGIPASQSTSLVAVNVLFYDVDQASGRSRLDGRVEYLGRGGIRDRGSSTAGQAKPNLTFEIWGPNGTGPEDDFDASLAGLPADSDWVLHAPFSFDPALIRNQLFFQLSRSVLPWAPHTQPVEVYLNRGDGTVTADDYAGTYVLIEKVKRGADRVDIAPITPQDNDPNSDAITGGYIFKVDRADPSEPSFSAGGYSSLNWVYPKSPRARVPDDQKATNEQQRWVQDHLNAFAATLSNPDLNDPQGYSQYIDVDSWIDNHLVNVLTYNVDAFRLSAYFFKDRGAKIEYGPPWDCDRCMESTDGRDDNPQKWYDPGGTDFFTSDTYSDPWFRQLFKDPSFWQAYIDRYAELRETIWSREGLDAMIDQLAAEVTESQVRNLARWGQRPRGTSAYQSGQLNGTWEGEIEHLRYWMHARAEFMDASFVGRSQLRIAGQALPHVPGATVAAGTRVEVVGPAVPLFHDKPLVSGAAGAIASYLVPSDDTLGESWAAPDFDDSAWATGPLGFGNDTGDDFTDLIRTEIVPQDIVDGATTVLTRMEFQVDDLDAIRQDSLVLRMKYDDGFVVYLNGQRILDRNLRDTELAWNSRASSHADRLAVVYEDSDLSEYLPLLVAGTNVLGIRVINSSATSNDLLLVPELISRQVEIVPSTTGTTYYTIDGSDPRAADGTPAATAILAQPDQPLVIDRNTRVSARTFDQTDRGSEAAIVLTDWGAPAIYDLIVEPLPVVISEVNYHPAPPTIAEQNAGWTSDDFEFIEIYNPNTTPASLVGAKLSGGVDFDFLAGDLQTLAPQAYALVVANRAAFETRYGAGLPIAGQFTGSLSNGGETLDLLDGIGGSVFSVDYSDSDPWLERADGLGATLEIVPSGAVPANRQTSFRDWQASYAPGGSPGAASTQPIGVVINELLAATQPPVNRSDSVELYNTTDSDILIGGWYLSDSSDFFKYQIPAGTTIPAGQYVVFDESQFNPTPQNPAANHFGLNGDEGDDLYLVIGDPTSGVTTFVDEAHFRASANGESWARIPNGTGRLTPAESLTFGAANSAARVGPLVISEIQYRAGTPSAEAMAANPAVTTADLEFVEIHNPTQAAVDLTHWRIRGGIDLDFDDGLSLAAGQTLVVLRFDPADPENARRVAAFRAHYGLSEEEPLVGGYAGRLGDSGDRVVLLRPGDSPADQPNLVPGIQEDEVLYDNLAPWPVAADGTGQSLQRTVLTMPGNDAANWSAGPPTPGRVSDGPRGDFDANGIIDTADINLLFEQLRAAVPDVAFDLTGDGQVDATDRDRLVLQTLNTTYGDANLDRVFDSSDLLQVLQGAEYEDAVPGNSTWEDGDWDGDGEFTSHDLVLAFQTRGIVLPPATITSPSIDAAFASLASAALDDVDAESNNFRKGGSENNFRI